jgi:hypothetical protein
MLHIAILTNYKYYTDKNKLSEIIDMKEAKEVL